MTLETLLQTLEDLRVQLWVADGKLRYRGPKQSLTPDLLAELKAHSEALLQRLAGPPAQTLSAPLTPGQRALWLHARLDPDSAAYHLAVLAETRPTLELERLQHALAELAAAHPMLATVFVEQADGPVQFWRPGLVPALTSLDLAEGQDLLSTAMTAADQPFDLSGQSPLRLVQIRGAGRAYLLVVAHHIALDFHALEQVLEDLDRLYLKPGSAAPAADHPFFRYARERALWLEGPRGQELWQRWSERLAELPPMLALPFDFPRPARSSHRGAVYEFALAAENTLRLRELARAHGTTPFVVLLACFQTWLNRVSGQRDMLLVTPASGRDQRDWEGVAGCFANPFVLRARLVGDPRLGDWIAAVRAEFLEAFSLSALPFPLLIERLQARAGLTSRHLFQVAFVWDQARPSSADGLFGPVLASQQRGADYDLTLTFFERGDQLLGSWTYATELFRAATLTRATRQFLNLLAGFLGTDNPRLCELDHLGAAERASLLVDWNRTAAPVPHETDIFALIEAAGARAPASPALQWLDDPALTYRELLAASATLGAALRGLGVGPERIVGICLERGTQRVLASLAVLWAGGAYLPMDPDYPTERLAFMTEDSRAILVLTRGELRGRLPATAPVLDLDRLEAAPLLERQPALADQAAYCIYTSGSTGRPKGVLIPQRGLVNLVTAQNRLFRVGPGDRMLQFASFSFDASVWEQFLALANGACLVLAPSEALAPGPELAQLMARTAVSHALLPPSSLPLLTPATCPAPRFLVVGGEALDPNQARAWSADRVLANAYGPTEATVAATLAVFADGDDFSAIGRPLPNSQVYVLDPALRPLGIGQTGELCIAGTGLARGYLGRPALTAARFLPHPLAGLHGLEPGARLYATGDLARFVQNDEGQPPQLHFLGRRDGQVKIRGFRVEVGELEAICASHPHVGQAVVVAQKRPGGAILVAYLTGRPDQKPPQPAEVRAFLADKLPAYMLPSALVVLDALPMTPANKVDRARLPDPLQSGAAAALPASTTERRLVEIWRQVLSHDQFSVDDNFFEVGGHSLLLTRLRELIQLQLGRDLPLVTLVRQASIAALAHHLDGEPTPAAAVAARVQPSDDAIAVIGMAGRFPGAADLDAFWELLRDGREAVRELDEHDLLAAGITAAQARHPRYVRRAATLDGIELFDNAFFGINPREAELLDPQQRLFLEAAWSAMEHAGYLGERAPGAVGVFAGCGSDSYLIHNLLGEGPELETSAYYQRTLGNDKDFLATRVSYKLGLHGPSMSVQSACSTSLLAVHLAAVSLRAGECDLALAGGVSIRVPQTSGYLFQEGMILSPDGHCRPFDRQAQGTVPGNGLGVVVLKRLAEAVADRDTIHGVIRGSAANNDGALKAGFTAPSSEGQAAVIAAALARAGLAPSSVSYLEAHGTGTPLGDPIELGALAQVFGDHPLQLGAVKANLGHLDSAAGITGLIKVLLMLRHRQLPPTPHFQAFNPELGDHRFQVVRALQPWHADGPLRAGVSSFGIGGTNVHMVVEQPPTPPPRQAQQGPALVPLSASDPEALAAIAARLADHLQRHPDLALADVAATLQLGRRAFAHRRVLVASDRDDLLRQLLDPNAGHQAERDRGRPQLAFMFPGQGSQFAAMGAELYRQRPVFRASFDRMADLVQARLDLDLRALVLGPADPERLRETLVAQPALLVLGLALADDFNALGLKADAYLGHSIGEYAAACLAGVFSREDAIALVCERARLLQALPRGAMLAVAASEATLLPLLGPELSLAAVNGPERCVVAGTLTAIDDLAQVLGARGLACSRLHTSHAFHSPMMTPILEAFRACFSGLALRPPTKPLLSNLTGTWADADLVCNPDYWVRHLREPVRFADNLAALAASRPVLLELGPGRALCQLAGPGFKAFPVLPRLSPDAAGAARLDALGRLWLAGFALDWSALQAEQRAGRVPLPSYPFTRTRHWVERRQAAATGPGAYLGFWKPAPPAEPRQYSTKHKALLMLIGQNGPHMLQVSARLTGWAIVRLLGDVPAALASIAARPPDQIIFLANGDADTDLARLLTLCTGLARAPQPLELTVITSGGLELHGAEALAPEAAWLFGPSRALALEHPEHRCRLVDLDFAAPRALDGLASELRSPVSAPVVALRGRNRWLRTYERIPDQSSTPALPPRPVVLITGGFGKMGLALARFLANHCGARLALCGRSAPPARAAWPAILGSDDPWSARVAVLHELERAGAELLLCRADVTERAEVQRLLAEVETHFGALHGVVHAAGEAGLAAFEPLLLARGEGFVERFAAKTRGTALLAELLADRDLCFRVAMSSLAAERGGFGLAAYSAANRAQDLFLTRFNREADQPWLSIAWDGWQLAALRPGDTDTVGLAADTATALFWDLILRRQQGQVIVALDHPASAPRPSATVARATPAPSASATAAAERGDAIQRFVVEVWQKLLGLEQIPLQRDFFELGGDSLAATRVLFQLEQRYGAGLTMGQFFEHPTVVGLAELVRAAAPEPDPFPSHSPRTDLALTPAQLRFWYLDRLADQRVNLLTAGLDLEGALDPSALEAALAATLAEHDSLRARFREHGGEPRCDILDRLDFQLGYVDLADLSPAARDRALIQLEQADARQRFDLERPPLLRALIAQIAERQHRLLLTLHHLVADGWSLDILTRALARHYAAALAGQRLPALAPRAGYADYVHWLERTRDAAAETRALDYWRRRLEGAAHLLELPTDRPRPAQPSHRLGSVPLHCDAPLTAALRARGQASGTSLFLLFQGAFALLIARQTHQLEPLIASPWANRPRPELADMVGCFLNTLVARVPVEREAALGTFLQGLRRDHAEDARHGQLPVERILQALGLGHDARHNPLFQVMLTLNETAVAGLSLPGLTSRLHRRPVLDAPLDLILELEVGAATIEGELKFSLDLFRPASAAHLAQQWLNLLEQLAQLPLTTPLQALEPMTADQRQALLHDWNRAASPLPEQSFSSLFRRQAQARPQALAAGCGELRLTYGELSQRVDRLAAELVRRGLRAEQVVVLYAERDLEFLIAVMAILASGGTYLPIDPGHPLEHQSLVLAQALPTLVLTRAPLEAGAAAAIARLEPRPSLLCLERLNPGEAPVPPAPLPDQRAYILFTSGSTGLPKGAMLTHRGMLNHLFAKVEDLAMVRSDVLVQNATQSFDISIWQMLTALLVGGQVLVYGRDLAHHPRRLIEACGRDRVTLLELVPSMLHAMLVELEETPERDPVFGQLRILMLTGEALPPSLCNAWFARFPAIPIVNAYGPTECSDDITHHTLVEKLAAAVAHTPIGTPVRNMRLYVLDRWLRPLPQGVPGELYAAGTGVGRGYLNRPARTALSFVPNPFASAAEAGSRLYKTGDLVRHLTEPSGRPGPLSFLGRLDAQVKVRGFRIELGEIEAALAHHPAVRETVVIVDEGAGEKRLVAYLVCRREAGQAEAELQRELRDFMAGRLPAYMVPAAFVLLEAMPLTPNGKLDRKALPAPVWAQPQAVEQPLGELAQRIAALWRETLGLAAAGLAANFFEGGGNSLSATRLLSRVQRDHGVELALKTFYADPTLAALIHHVAQQAGRAVAALPLFPVSRDQHLPLSFAQQRLWFFEHLDQDRERYIMPFAVAIAGRPDLARLERAFNQVVARHEILRTAYLDDERGAGQIVRPARALPFALLDLSGLTPADQQRALDHCAQRRARLPFDLGAGDVLRAAVVRRAPADHLLLLEIHHIAFDGWSGQVLFDELDRLYHGHPLAAPALQYADFATWQRQWFATGALEPQLRYWLRQLQGAPRLELPFTEAQGAGPDGRVELELGPALSARVLAHSQAARVSVFTCLLAAYQHLLYALTGQTDLVIGTDFANRGRVELENMLGFFVNMLPLRTRLDGGYHFDDLLDAAKRTLLEAEAAQALPFDRLVNALGLERDSSGQPLVRALFVLDNARAQQGSFGDLQWRLETLVPPHPKFDLSVFVSELPSGLRFVFAYRGALFRHQRVLQLAEEYRHLLEQVLDQPKEPLDRFKTLSRLEKERTAMETESKKAFSLKNLRQTQRRPVDLSPQALVTRSFPAGEERLPLMIQPVRNDVDLLTWAQLDREAIERDLARYGAILFRGFGVADNSAFSAFAGTFCSGLYGDYGDLPEEDAKLKVYKSTPYPIDKTILFHNESSHMHRWPTRQFFYCAQAAEEGGETPLVDCRQVYRALDPELARLFREQGLCYVRNFSPGLDVPWQHFFKTESREEVARYCAAAGMTHEWLGPEHLRVSQRALAVLDHPLTGEPSFFNQVQLHHPSCLDQEIRASLGEVWDERSFPRNVFFGDGSPIPDALMARIDELYWRHAVALPWQNGDIIMLDNLLVAHARNPFRGPRKIVVAMGDMMVSPLAPTAVGA